MKVTAEDVARILASPLPRQVPAHVAKAARGGSPWLTPLLGIAFFFFGLIFVVVFFPWRILDDWKLLSDDARTVKGNVVSVRETNMSVNRARVRDYEFSYTVGDGRQRNAHCYDTGRYWSARMEVTVRYLPTHPEIACIEGARLSKAGWAGAMTLIFPMVGAGIFLGSFVGRRNTRQLLRSGRAMEVDIVSVERTNMQINNRYVYKIKVALPNLLQEQPVVIRCSDPGEVALVQKRVADRQSIYALCDPNNPRRLFFPEGLIGR